MAFVSMFFLFLVILLGILGFCTVVALILLVVSFVMQSKQKRKLQQSGEYYLIPRIIGGIFLIPLVGLFCLVMCAFGATFWEQHTSLGYCVTNGYYERAELLLKLGVDPDCTLESNQSAKDGEQTLLSVLCENGGFLDIHENPADEAVTEEEKAMICLLLEYGADIEARTYRHGQGNAKHILMESSDYNQDSDECGYTPLLHAVASNQPEIVKLLLEKGADVNVKDYCGFNAVHIVADNYIDKNGVPLLEILLTNDAKVDEKTNYGQDALFLACRHDAGKYEWPNEEIKKMIFFALYNMDYYSHQ